VVVDQTDFKRASPNLEEDVKRFGEHLACENGISSYAEDTLQDDFNSFKDWLEK
jgi:hypothetical protein